MDLFSGSERIEIRGAFTDLHDSFGKDVTILTEIKQSSSSPSNPLFPESTSPKINTSSEIIKARVKFMDRSEVAKIPGIGAQTNMSLPEGLLRLKIKASDYNKARKASKFVFGGLTYILYTDAGKIGPFDADYYALYLKRAD